MEENTGREVIVCTCNSIDHQVAFTYLESDDDYDELSLEVHLTPYGGFFKRIWHAIKYVFGYRSRYGDWDNIIFDPKDCDKIIKHFERLKTSYEKVNNSRINGLN